MLLVDLLDAARSGPVRLRPGVLVLTLNPRGEQAMSETQARALAAALSMIHTATAFNSGGNIWLVRTQKPDGRLVIFDAADVCEYLTETDFERGTVLSMITY